MSKQIEQIKKHQINLSECERCENMIGPSVVCQPVSSSIMLIGQAPGDKEPALGRPFAWTAGKTLFKWFSSLGVNEEKFREKVYMAAVCRCFPGKNQKGSGDRVPDKQEIANCEYWLNQEYQIMQPKLIIPVGKLAITQFLKANKLVDVVGQQFVLDTDYLHADCIPLPHPSGLSTWFHMEPGKTLLQDSLRLIKAHSAWQEVFENGQKAKVANDITSDVIDIFDGN